MKSSFIKPKTSRRIRHQTSERSRRQKAKRDKNVRAMVNHAARAHEKAISAHLEALFEGLLFIDLPRFKTVLFQLFHERSERSLDCWLPRVVCRDLVLTKATGNMNKK